MKANNLKINFPTGVTNYELLYYMGVDWKEDKEPDQQKLIEKCEGKNPIELNKYEAELLLWEVNNTLDIKADHVGYEGWNALQQHNLSKFAHKLYTYIKQCELCEN